MLHFRTIKIIILLCYSVYINEAMMMLSDPKQDVLIGCEHEHPIRHRHKKILSSKDCALNKSSIFMTKNNTMITAQTGSTAILPCVLFTFVNGVVSWKRLKEYRLLTVGSTRYTRSNRFFPDQIKTPQSQQWRLIIKFVQHEDAGVYECQVSTYPPQHIHMRLRVVDAYAVISGSPELHVKNGSEMQLTCKFHHTTEEPSYVFWYHEEHMISFEQSWGISAWKNKSLSVLTINRVMHYHSGNYTCVPSNTKPASITVHILDDEKPAAMHDDDSRSVAVRQHRNKFAMTFITIILVPYYYYYNYYFNFYHSPLLF